MKVVCKPWILFFNAYARKRKVPIIEYYDIFGKVWKWADPTVDKLHDFFFFLSVYTDAEFTGDIEGIVSFCEHIPEKKMTFPENLYDFVLVHEILHAPFKYFYGFGYGEKEKDDLGYIISQMLAPEIKIVSEVFSDLGSGEILIELGALSRDSLEKIYKWLGYRKKEWWRRAFPYREK